MVFPIAWAVGSFIGGLLTKEFYDDVIAEHDDDCEEKAGYSDEMLTALYKKLTNASDAQGLYDFGCILENENEKGVNVNYGPDNLKYYKPSNSIVIGVRYNQFQNISNDETAF